MSDPFWIVAAVFLGLFLVFTAARLVFAAYFRSKREFLRSLWNDANKGDK